MTVVKIQVIKQRNSIFSVQWNILFMLLNIIDALTGLMKTNCSEWRLQWLEMTIIRDLSRGSVSLLEISGWLYYNKLHVCGQWWRVKLSEWVKIHLKNVSITVVSADQSRPQHAATSSKILSLQLMLGLHTVNMYVSTQLSQVTQIEIENHMWQQNTGWFRTFLLKKYLWTLLLRILVQLHIYVHFYVESG